MSYPHFSSDCGEYHLLVSDRLSLRDVDKENQKQVQTWGEQNHPDGTGRPGARELADHYRAVCKANGPERDNWQDILAEEVFEAFAETDEATLRTELVQAAAVITHWIDAIDRRRPIKYAVQDVVYREQEVLRRPRIAEPCAFVDCMITVQQDDPEWPFCGEYHRGLAAQRETTEG